MDRTTKELCSAEHIIKTHWPNRLRDALLAQKKLLEEGTEYVKLKVAIHAEEQEVGKAGQKLDLTTNGKDLPSIPTTLQIKIVD
jgi:hypothetical protein